MGILIVNFINLQGSYFINFLFNFFRKFIFIFIRDLSFIALKFAFIYLNLNFVVQDHIIFNCNPLAITYNFNVSDTEIKKIATIASTNSMSKFKLKTTYSSLSLLEEFSY